jgi:hypothetical protein
MNPPSGWAQRKSSIKKGRGRQSTKAEQEPTIERAPRDLDLAKQNHTLSGLPHAAK